MASRPRTRRRRASSPTPSSGSGCFAATPTPVNRSMSTIQSPSALDLVAEAIVAEAQASVAHRRLFLGRYLGLEPSELHSALLERAGTTLELVDDVAPFRAVAAGDALLIPYLVVPASDSGGNRGSQG